MEDRECLVQTANDNLNFPSFLFIFKCFTSRILKLPRHLLYHVKKEELEISRDKSETKHSYKNIYFFYFYSRCWNNVKLTAFKKFINKYMC